MLCAAIDIGSNTTRLLVAEPQKGQLRKVMEQKAYTRIGHDVDEDGRITENKIEEVAAVVATQMRLAQELGAEQFRVVATAAIREAVNGEEASSRIAEVSGLEVEIVSEQEEGRLAFIGATKTLGYTVEGRVAVVDVGGGSTEIIIGTLDEGIESVRSWPVGSGRLADRLIYSDPPAPAEIAKVRAEIEGRFGGIEAGCVDQAVAVGGSANATRRLIGNVVDHETLERAVRVLAEQPAESVARRFEIDRARVRVLATGVLLLERASDLIGLPLQIGKGGLREGVVLDLLNGHLGLLAGAR